MNTTAPNMNIAVRVLTNVAAFSWFTHTFVFIISYVCEFPDIWRVVTLDADFSIFTYFDTLLNTHTNESWTSSRKTRTMIIVQHPGVPIFTQLVTNATILMSPGRLKHCKRLLGMFSILTCFAVARGRSYFWTSRTSFCIFGKILGLFSKLTNFVNPVSESKFS